MSIISYNSALKVQDEIARTHHLDDFARSVLCETTVDVPRRPLDDDLWSRSLFIS